MKLDYWSAARMMLAVVGVDVPINILLMDFVTDSLAVPVLTGVWLWFGYTRVFGSRHLEVRSMDHAFKVTLMALCWPAVAVRRS
jgi:hypothetical protein